MRKILLIVIVLATIGYLAYWGISNIISGTGANDQAASTDHAPLQKQNDGENQEKTENDKTKPVVNNGQSTEKQAEKRVEKKKERKQTTTVSNPDDILVLVNKTNHLPSDYEPADLVVPNVPFPFKEDLPKKKLRAEAAKALEALFAAAEKEGLELYAQSGYRSFERQKAIFAFNAEQRGEEVANRVSARPGESEHQTGLAMDVTCRQVGFDLVEAFADTPEGQWLAANAHTFGFIIRYPKGKEAITGYQYEPWHLRYVGIKAAQEITSRQLTLEEYLERQSQ